jgi:hypothetical protein
MSRRKVTHRQTLSLRVDTLRLLKRLARCLDDLPREQVRFNRSTRQRLSTAEVAEAAITVGIAELVKQHGIPDQALSEVRDD